jgi:pyridoxine 5-phosphate synthase
MPVRSLVVDADAVAALRDHGGIGEPRLAAFALAAELAGADAVRLGVNESLRPVREGDLHDVRRVVRRMEMQLAPTPSLLKLALEVRPDCVVLASEPTPARRAGTPLDLAALRSGVPLAVRALREAGIPTLARVGPDAEAVKLARAAEVAGVEIATAGVVDLPDAERAAAWERCADAARIAAKLRLPLALGGGLASGTLRGLLALLASVEKIVTGRALVARALLVGVERAVRELRDEVQ